MTLHKEFKENKHWVESEKMAQKRIEQARTLKNHASNGGGLKFEAYLTPDLAVWVLDMVERGVFIDPSEAVFVFMGQAKDIELHNDIKLEILKRRLGLSIEDMANEKTFTTEEVQAHMKNVMEDRIEPALWNKISQEW